MLDTCKKDYIEFGFRKYIVYILFVSLLFGSNMNIHVEGFCNSEHGVLISAHFHITKHLQMLTLICAC